MSHQRNNDQGKLRHVKNCECNTEISFLFSPAALDPHQQEFKYTRCLHVSGKPPLTIPHPAQNFWESKQQMSPELSAFSSNTRQQSEQGHYRSSPARPFPRLLQTAPEELTSLIYPGGFSVFPRARCHSYALHFKVCTKSTTKPPSS